MKTDDTATIRRFPAENAGTFACFRLPGAAEAVCLSGKCEEIDDISGQGFVIAPFRRTKDCPAVIIRPERTERVPLAASRPTLREDIRPESRPEERRAYAEGFAVCRQALVAGQLKKVVYARRHTLSLDAADEEALGAYFLRACRLYPQHYVALWRTAPTGTWLVASPELLVSARTRLGETCGTTMALAGTLGATDEHLSGLDAWDKKNREEQRLVTHYITDRLRRHCTDIRVGEPRPVRSGSVAHLCTTLSFRSRTADVGRIARLLHPTPAVCGLPAEEAARILTSAENAPRRYYAGYSGPCAVGDAATRLFVSLRCLEIQGTSATLYAGGGLLKESTEADEWEETQRKLSTILAIIGRPQP